MFKVGDRVVTSGFREPRRNGTWMITGMRGDGNGVQINGLWTATPPYCYGEMRLAAGMPGVKTGRVSCGAFEVGDRVVTDRSFAKPGVYTITRLHVEGKVASLVYDEDGSEVHVLTTSLSAAPLQEGGIVDTSKKWWTDEVQKEDRSLRVGLRCECGSGGNVVGPLHSDWCVLWRV